MEASKVKGRWFTFALKFDHECDPEKVTEVCYEAGLEFAFIDHEFDTKDGGELVDKHRHFLLVWDSPRSIGFVAALVGVPDNMIQLVRSKKGILGYLTHENQPEKHHYDVEEIKGTLDVQAWKEKTKDTNIMGEYEAYRALRCHLISPQEYLELVKGQMEACGFGTRLRVYEHVYNAGLI